MTTWAFSESEEGGGYLYNDATITYNDSNYAYNFDATNLATNWTYETRN